MSSIIPSLPFDKPPRFSLDLAGVSSLLGGEEALSAMTAVHVYGKRRWLGWFNNPGSFQMAKRLNAFAKSASFKPVSKGTEIDPTALIGLDSFKGPKFRAAHSGTVIQETSYLASLFVKGCAALEPEGKVVPGRRTQPVAVTVADLGSAPAPEIHPARSNVSTLLLAYIPILTSFGACALCAVGEDWYASSLILVGIIAGGASGLVVGSADFVFTHPEPAKGSPAGDGVLGTDNDIILLRGTESAVNSITRGKFTLRFSSEGQSNLEWCSFLFFIQSLTQLFLIPQASLFGQIIFLTSIAVSALYNAWLSSLDKETIHRKMLFGRVLENPTIAKYTLGTRTAAVVFILLVLKPSDPAGLLNELLPNDTKVWTQWKATILNALRQPSDQSFQVGNLVDLNGFMEQERNLLGLLHEDARAAYNGYKGYLQTNSV